MLRQGWTSLNLHYFTPAPSGGVPASHNFSNIIYPGCHERISLVLSSYMYGAACGFHDWMSATRPVGIGKDAKLANAH